MKPCITTNSLKLFGKYFQDVLPGIISRSDSYKDVMQKVYNQAMTDFASREYTEQGVSTAEVILQHMTIVPALTRDLNLEPEFAIPFDQEARNFRNAVKNADLFGKVVADLANIVNSAQTLTAVQAPVDESAIRVTYETTHPRELVFDAINNVYVKEELEPALIGLNNTIRKIIQDNNTKNYKLSLKWLDNKAMLEIVDSSGEPVYFDELGNVSNAQKGEVRRYEVIYNKAALKNTLKAVIANETVRLAGDNITAIKNAKAAEDNYVKFMTNAVAKVKAGETVIYDINLADSSAGYVETNYGQTTPLNSVTNVDEFVFSVANGNLYAAIPKSKHVDKLLPNTLESLSEADKGTILELLTNNNLKDTNGNPLTSADRLALLRSYIRIGADGFMVSFAPANAKNAGQVQNVKFGGQSFTVSANTVKPETAELNKTKLQEAFTEYLSKPIITPLSNSNVNIPKGNVTASYEDVVSGKTELAHQSQILVDENGIKYIAKKPDVSFYPVKNRMPDKVQIVASIKNNVVNTELISGKEWFIKSARTTAAQNSKGEVRGYSPYLAFTDVKHNTQQPTVADIGPLFMTAQQKSLAVEKKGLEITEKNEIEAQRWYESSEWSKILKLTVSGAEHERGPEYIASFIGNVISLYKGSDRTAIYHEVFHAFARGILTAEERKAVYKEVLKDLKGQTADIIVKGVKKTVAFSSLNMESDADMLTLEEWMAEEFRAYAKEKSAYNNKPKSKLAQFFEKVVQIIRDLLGNYTYAEVKTMNALTPRLKAMFNDIYEGNIDFSRFEPVHASEEYNMSVEMPTVELSYQEVRTTMEFMQTGLYHFLDLVVTPTSDLEMNKKLAAKVLEMSTYHNTTPEYAKARQEYAELVGMTVRGDSNSRGLWMLEENPELLKMAFEFLLNKLELRREVLSQSRRTVDKQVVATLTKVIDNFGDVSTNVKDYIDDSKTILGVFLNNYSALKLEDVFEDDVVEEGVDNLRQLFDTSGGEVSMLDSIDARTRELLSTLPYYNNKGRGDLRFNSFGAFKTIPMNKIIARVIDAVGDAYTMQEMYDALQRAAKDPSNPSMVKDQTLKVLVDRLGNPSKANIHSAEIQQWVKFRKAFAKPLVKLRTFEIEKVATVTEDTADLDEEFREYDVSLIAKNAKGQYKSSIVRREWAFAFSYLLSVPETKETPSNIKENNKFSPTRFLEYFEQMVELDPKTGKVYETKQSGFFTMTKRRYEAEPALMFQALGMNIPNIAEVNQLFINGSDRYEIEYKFLEYFVNSIRNRDKALYENQRTVQKLDDLFKGYSYRDSNNEIQDQPDLSGYLNRMTVVAIELGDDYSTFMQKTPEGENQSEKPLHSSLTTEVSVINSASSIDDLLNISGMQQFDFELNPEIAASNTFMKMFNLDLPLTDPRYGQRNEGIKITIENLAGSKVREGAVEKGVKSLASDEFSKFETDFHVTLDGFQEILRSADKSTSLISILPSIDQNGQVTNVAFSNKLIDFIMQETYKTNMTPQGFVLYDKFVSHIESELVRIHRVRSIKAKLKSGELDSVDFDLNFILRGDAFIKFANILSPATQKKLLALKTADGNLINQSFTLRKALMNDAEFRKTIELELLGYFDLRVGQVKEKFGKRIIVGDNILAKHSLASDVSEENTIDRLFYMFGVNNFYNNMEYQALFLGDVSNYKFADEDFHKRIAGKISAGDSIVNETAWYNYINSAEFNKDGFAKKAYDALSSEQKEALGLPAEFESRTYDGYLRTGVMNEAISESVYADAYKELFGISEKPYKKMEEADGAMYIQFDTYRVILRSLDEWSAGQEELYQRMLRGEKINQLTINNTFPIKKWQYYGPLFNESFYSVGLMPYAFHKYSVVPLIPGTLENTPLEDLHNRMLTEGIDYMTFKSGSKLSSITKVTSEALESGQTAYDNIYDVQNGRQITNNQVTPNILHVKHLKSQVRMAEGFKGKINLFSQMRKIATLGTFSGGVPVGFKGTKAEWDNLSEKQKLKNKYYVWFKQYNEVLDEIRRHARANLLENLGLKAVVNKKTNTVTYEGDTKELVKYIKQELANKNLMPEELAHIIKPGTDGQMVEDLSFSLNAAKIEEVLMTLVDNELRNLSFNGEGLVQMPGTMTESKDSGALELATQEEIFEHGTNGLSFYHVVDKDGKPVRNEKGFFRVKEAQVKIALQGDFKNLLYLTYKGETIAKYDEVEDEATGKKTRTLDFDASLKALNAALKDKAFAEEHKDKLRLVGPRIPTQAENSIESMVVAEFLPPIMGNRIILPSEIVAKAGSDYDIDKLFMMFPSMRRYGNSVELIKYIPNVTESDTELKAKITEYEKEIKQLRAVVDQAYMNKSDLYNNIKGVQGAFKEQHAEIFEERKAIQAEIARSLEEASDVYNNRNGYENYTRTQQIQYHQISNEKREGLYSLLSAVEQLIDNAYKEFVEENNIPAELIDRNAFESNDKVIADANAKIQALQEKKYDTHRRLDGKSNYGLQNQLLDLFAQRVSFADNAKGLLEPNSTDLFDELANKLDQHFRKQSIYDKFNTGAKGTGTGVQGTTLYDYLYNLQKHQDNSGGMSALGVAAVTSTFYAIFTQMGATLNGVNEVSQKEFNAAVKTIAEFDPTKAATPAETIDYYKAKSLVDSYKDYTIKMPHNSINGFVSLSNLENVDGVSISNVIGQMINGFVDVAKEAWIFNIEGTMQNTPQLLLMIMAGVSVENAVYMSTHPIVREYNKLRSEYEGVFATVDKEAGTELFVKSSKQASYRAQQEMQNRLDLKTSFEEINKMIAEPFTTQELSEAVFDLKKKEYTQRDIQVLAHYISLQSMSDDVTEFTMVTKFDTQKLQNLSEAEARLTQTEEIMSKDKSFDNEWFELIQETPIGKFNNDEFVLDLFSKYFGVRNNGIVIKKSTGVRPPKGVDKAFHLKNYKDDFLWFMYQNAVYQSNRYKEFNIVYDTKYKEGVVIDGAVVHVNEEQATKEMAAKSFSIGPFFPQLGHYVRFEVERQRLYEAHGKAAILDFGKFVKRFGSFQNMGAKLTQVGMLNKMALFYSQNNVSMFSFSHGYAGIFKHLQLKFADEFINNDLFNDLKYDYSEDQANLYLESLSNEDPTIVSVYRENLQELKESKIPEVAEFFNQFEHYAIMQSGLNKGKYNLTRIIDEALFINIIDEAYDIDSFTDTLDRSTKLLKQGVKLPEIKTEVLDLYHEMFVALSADIKAYRKRTKGQNYINEHFGMQSGTTAIDLSLSYENVSVYESFKNVPADVIQVKLEDLYNANNKLNTTYINSLKGKKLAVLKHKFTAPEGASQTKLDQMLLSIGIDNSKNIPKAVMYSKGQTANNISIASSEVLKTYALKDEVMANKSTKAIGQVTQGYAPKYRSSTEAYVNTILENYPQRLAGTKGMSFKADDIVWIFGSGVFQNAYTGVMSKEQWTAKVQETFDNYYKKQIDRAIEAGVISFNVGVATGIDTMAIEYLQSKGFTPMTRYTNAGKYVEMVTSDYVAKATDYYPLGATPVSAKGLLDIDLYDKELDSKLAKLTKEELQEGIGYAMTEASVLKKIADRKAAYADGQLKLRNAMMASIGSPLAVGNGLQASYIEEILMKMQLLFKAHAEKSSNSRARRAAESSGQVLAEKLSKPGERKSFENSLFRGQEDAPIINENGELVILATYDSLFKSTGASFAKSYDMAQAYGARYSKNPYVIEINKDYADKISPLIDGGAQSYGNRVIGDQGEERFISKNNLIIPKGMFTIHRENRFFNTNTYSAKQLMDAYNKQFIEDDIAEYNRYGEASKGYATEGSDYYEAIENELLKRGISKSDFVFLRQPNPIYSLNTIVGSIFDIQPKADELEPNVSQALIDKYLSKQKELLSKLNNQVNNSIAAIPILQQNFADGSKFKENNTWVARTMRPEFQGKSSMELVLSGQRTRTSRSKTAMKELMTQLNVARVSEIIGKELYMLDSSGAVPTKALVQITNVYELNEENQNATWQKEGWTKDVTDRLIGKGYYGVEFTVVGVENLTAADIQRAKNKNC